MAERYLPFDKVIETTRESLVEAPTLSSRLVHRLASRFYTPEDELGNLAGTKVMLMGFHHQVDLSRLIIGRVVSVKGRDIRIRPEIAHTFYSEGFDERLQVQDPQEISVKGYLLSKDPFEDGHIDDDLEVQNAIFCSPPSRVSIIEEDDTELIGFNAGDPELDFILHESLHQFPDIKTAEDIAELTSWLHERVPYKFYDEPTRPSYLSAVRLGKEISEFGAVCRQIAAVELAVLELSGMSTVPIGSFVDGVGHLYLGIDGGIEGQEERVIVDPTWNVVGTFSQVKDNLISRELVTEFHSPANVSDLLILPDWTYKDHEVLGVASKELEE